MIANLFEFSLFSKKVKKWFVFVQKSLIVVQNKTNHENGHHSPKQTWAHYRIFEYIQIFWTNIFIHKNTG